VWVDRNGATHDAFNEPREFQFVRLSPDGRRAALGISTGTGNNVWILDLAAGTLTPLTTAGRSRNPSWSSDSRRILFGSNHSGQAALWWQPADGSGPAVMAGVPRHNPWFVDLSPDGHTTVFNAIYDGTFNLETFSLDAEHAEHDVSASPIATEVLGRFSPDGHFIAYNSDESGRAEVYVRSFPDVGSRIQISTGGGRRPVWAPDGKTLYYWEGARLTSATLAREPVLRVVSRKPLFDGHYETDYDISHDGTRFLMIQTETSGLNLVVIPDWQTELRQVTTARKQ
jgi:Tol biopolymer transport system component